MAEGDISAPIDTLIWNALTTTDIRAIHVTGNIYAIVIQEQGDQGKVSTIEIDEDGNIGAALIDTLTFDGVTKGWPDIVHVTGNIYAIVNTGWFDDGFLHTVDIDEDGNIGAAVIDSFEFDTVNCRAGRIFHVAGTTFAIAYSLNYTGKLVTITIGADGAITEPVIDTMMFDAAGGHFPSVIKVADNVFAIFYNRLNGPGRVVTVGIDDAGEIADAEIDSAEIDANPVAEGEACLVGETIYAYAYRSGDTFHYVKTIKIEAAGTIGSVLDSLKFDAGASNGYGLHALRISATIMAVAYSGADSDGFLKTIEIDAAGAITDPVVDTLEFDTDVCYYPVIILIAENIYALFYAGASVYGTIITPGIEAAAAGRVKSLMQMGIG